MPSESTAWRAIFKTLKPCPLDGQSVGFYKVGDWYSIRCGTCGLKLEKHQQPEKVAEFWNTRVCNCGLATQTDEQQDLFTRAFGE